MAGHEEDHSSTFSAKVNKWSYIASPPCLQDVYKGNFAMCSKCTPLSL